MQGGRGGGRDPFFDFGDPFGGFGGFGGPRNSLLSNFFGGRDPFDDPFFTRPIGSVFEPSSFGPGRSPFLNMHQTGFIEHQAPEPKRPRGPIIEELNSDDEKEEANKDTKEYPRKHGRLNDEPCVEVPDDEPEQSERRNSHLQYMNGFNSSYHRQQQHQQPQTRSFTFQSSSFTDGGANGAYYTSSKTRTGNDGVTFEESKEADTTTGQASHRVSRGLHDRGHSVMRKLNSDGRVDMMQTLHNLNQDELAGFEESWNGNAQKHLPGWSGSFNGHDSIVYGRSGQNGKAGQGVRALPSTKRSQQSGRVMSDARDRAGSSHSQQSRMKGLTNFKDKSSRSQGN